MICLCGVLLLGSGAFGHEGRSVHLGLSSQGPGLTVGDWRLGVTLTTSTDASQDTARSRELARLHQLDQIEARRMGDQAPDALGGLLRLLAIKKR